jgi:hypothetical protein
MRQFVAWPFGTQPLRECPAVVAGFGFTSVRFCREPPDLGAGTVRRLGCRCGRFLPQRALLCWRGGLPRATFGRGRGTTFRFARAVLARRRLLVLRLGGRGLLVGGHARVPPNRVRWVGAPDWVESSLGWVLPGCGIAERPLPRLIHRRRSTVLCRSRDGTAPALLARGRPFRDAGPLRGACRRRRRPRRLILLSFPFAYLIRGLLSPPQPECGQEPAEESARTLFLDLRCFIGSPSDGSRLPSQQLRGGAWTPRAPAKHTRCLDGPH